MNRVLCNPMLRRPVERCAAAAISTIAATPASASAPGKHPELRSSCIVPCTRSLSTTTTNHLQSSSKISSFFKAINIMALYREKMRINRKNFRVALLYEKVADHLDYGIFFKTFKMEDSFFSWFLVTELHVWMLMVRLMAERDDSKEMKKTIIEIMWKDVNNRVEKLGSIRRKLKAKQLQDISHQFNAALFGYDEGISSDDRVLAGALWRRFFQLQCDDPEAVEAMVEYVRKNVQMLDLLPIDRLLHDEQLQWKTLRTDFGR